MEIKDIKNKIVALATIGSDGKPHNIAVELNSFENNKVVITNNEMKTTVENIKSNPYVSLVYWKGDDGVRIDGKVEYFDSGKWLDFVKGLPENKGFAANGALVIEVNKITKLG
ncbi:pyridoxamine 5'-phosphate oxidase family protein [Candidatus Pacearchaeota archaeon]|nr:pyridoxamine 5'-phosphate oxidase family protein [Candidatus Pacearchaeota archaeon]